MSFCPSMRNLCAFSDSSFTSWRWSTRTKFEPSMLSSSGNSLERTDHVLPGDLLALHVLLRRRGQSSPSPPASSAWFDAFRKRAIPMQPSASRGRSRTTLVSASSAFLYSAKPLRARDLREVLLDPFHHLALELDDAGEHVGEIDRPDRVGAVQHLRGASTALAQDGSRAGRPSGRGAGSAPPSPRGRSRRPP